MSRARPPARARRRSSRCLLRSLAAASVPEPVAERRQHDQGEADLLHLTQAAGALDAGGVEEIVHQPRQVEDQRHPVVRVRWVQLVAKDLARDRGDAVRDGRASDRTPARPARPPAASRTRGAAPPTSPHAPRDTKRSPPHRHRGSAARSPPAPARCGRRWRAGGPAPSPLSAAIASAASTTRRSIADASAPIFVVIALSNGDAY